MGCGHSAMFDKEWLLHRKAYEALRMGRSDVFKLWKVFRHIDTGAPLSPPPPPSFTLPPH